MGSFYYGAALVPADPETLEHPDRQRERQPDNVRIVASEPIDEDRSPALDRVPSRLAHALAEPRVGIYLLFEVGSHAHARDRVSHHLVISSCDGDAGVDLVGASAQEQEHLAHLLGALGLAEDPPSLGEVHDRVRRENDVVRISGDSERLAAGVGLDGLLGVFERELRETALSNLEVVAHGAEQPHPPRRLGGEDEPHSLEAEEEIELSPGALRGVGAVDEVVGEAERQVPPDGARGGIGRVGGAHEVAHHLDGTLAPDPHRDYGGRGYERDELLEKGLVTVLGVVLLGQFPAHVHELEVADVEALTLYAADDLADEPAPHAVPLHQHQSLFQNLSPSTSRSFFRSAG